MRTHIGFFKYELCAIFIDCCDLYVQWHANRKLDIHVNAHRNEWNPSLGESTITVACNLHFHVGLSLNNINLTPPKNHPIYKLKMYTF